MKKQLHEARNHHHRTCGFSSRSNRNLPRKRNFGGRRRPQMTAQLNKTMIEELKKGLEADPTNPFLQGHIEALESSEKTEPDHGTIPTPIEKRLDAMPCFPKIIQLLLTPNDSTWQGVLLGLADNGNTYRLDYAEGWVIWIDGISK